MSDLYGTDAFSPDQVAEKVEAVGVKKANLPLLSMTGLGILAGGFIGLGAMFFTLVTSDASLSFAASRLLGGLVFCLGLVLVVVAGAELFTGNNLMIMAWVNARISTALLLRNFGIVYLANFTGAAGLAALVALSGHWKLGDIEAHAINIAVAKTTLPFGEALVRGMLCNVLVCLAVWLTMAGRNVTDKILAVIFPITAFVACGYEHCVANMYFIPLGMMLQHAAGTAAIEWSGLFRNLVPVTLGNLLGGSVMVGWVYWVIYRRTEKKS